jgi:hypothetical protein
MKILIPALICLFLAIPSQAEIITVDDDGPADFDNIQAAINYANDDDTVLVAEGTYRGTGNRDIDFLGKAITVRSTDPCDPAVVAATVIDCQSSGRAFYFHSGEDANSIVAGLTVENGEIQGTASNYDAHGGGILCSGASPTILNCSILNCSVYAYDCSHCFGSSADSFGGGIACISNSHPTIINCKISGNLAQGPDVIEGWPDAYGGGVFCSSGSTVAIYNSRITANIAHGGRWHSDASWISYACNSYGGGIYISGSIGSEIKNCLIANNEAVLVTGEDYEGINYGKSQGAGIFCENDVNVVNCTLVGNKTDPTGIRGDGGGIYGPSMVTNNIIWDNLSASQLFGTTSVTYSDIEGGFSGTGNIDTDPCFADPYSGDYHLQSEAGRWDTSTESWVMDANTSVAIDAGNPGCPLGDEPNDVNNIRINMGAYGGTAEASKTPADWRSIADLTNDWVVDFNDLEVFVNYWLETGQCIPSDLNRNQSVNFSDFAIFGDNWPWP